MGGLVAGLLSGLPEELNRGIARHREDQAAQDQFELAVLQHLATATDPSIRTMAVAGLLEHQQQLAKRTKGGGGILGKLFNKKPQENETFRKLQEILGQFGGGAGAEGAGAGGGGASPTGLGAETSTPTPGGDSGLGLGSGSDSGSPPLDLLSLLSKGPGSPSIMSPGQPTRGASSPTPAGLMAGGPSPAPMPPQGAAAPPPRGQDLVSAQGPISPMAAGTGGPPAPAAAAAAAPGPTTPPPGPEAGPGGGPGGGPAVALPQAPADFSSFLSQVSPPEAPPSSLADIYSEVAGTFKPDALGNLGPLGDKAFTSELGGRVTAKQAYSEQGRARRSAASLAAAGQRAVQAAQDAMARTKLRTDANWDRMKEQQKFKAAHPSGTRGGTFNAAAFRVRAQRDYGEDVLQIQGQTDRAISQLRVGALKSFLGEDEIAPIVAEIQASATRRIAELETKHQQLLDEIEKGAGAGAGPRTGPGTSSGAGAGAGSDPVVKFNGRTGPLSSFSSKDQAEIRRRLAARGQ